LSTAAHRAAVDSGGRTVAVIGTGIGRTYPAEDRGLQDEIARRGLVLSQFWPDAGPDKHTFPMRNVCLSGYGLATVVVEASEKSGARIQARLAVEHGRQVILTDQVVVRNEWAQALLTRSGEACRGPDQTCIRTRSASILAMSPSSEVKTAWPCSAAASAT
jgi:DNA processing protein